ncbi:MAG TPA: hypothetical protein VMZ03_11180 [Chitinophagaceae bacterium]|nr:hypothetical protein [Chitinophagaceae bacterium]
MAHANNSIITGKFKGALGKQLVFREWQGKTIVSKAPKPRTGDPTPAQAQTQEKFLLASRYAKAVMASADQGLFQAYAKAVRPRQNAYCRAMEDFLSSPVIKNIDTRNYSGAPGNKIVVRALDDFRVTDVRVEIYDAAGSLIDAADAVQNINGIDWTYVVTVAHPIVAGTTVKAVATDVPGNEGSLEVIL